MMFTDDDDDNAVVMIESSLYNHPHHGFSCSIYQDIKQSAFTVNCYNSKVQMINFVTTECSQGNGDIFSLYTQGIAMFDTNAGQCEHNLGLLHVTEDVIKTSMKDIAKMMNFKENCILNSRISKKYACQLKNSGYDIEGIAKK